MSRVLGSQRWMLRGACRQVDPELFFPPAAEGPAKPQVEAAKAVCAACAVRPNCLSYALEARPDGIWGGTTPQDRVMKLPGRTHDSHLAGAAGEGQVACDGIGSAADPVETTAVERPV